MADRPRRLALLLAVLAACGDAPPPEVPPALPAATPQPTPAADPTPEGSAIPPPRTSRGLGITSRLTFTARPDLPHELTVYYDGPEHVRWTLALLGDVDRDRIVDLRSGERVWEYPKDSSASLEFQGLERARVLRRMALRYATFTWPAGELPWEELPDGTWRCPLPGVAGAELGLVRRELRRHEGAEAEAFTAYAPRPSASPAGGPALDALEPEETLLVLERERGSSRPRRLALHLGATEVWREEVLEVTTDVWLRPESFVPGDRR